MSRLMFRRLTALTLVSAFALSACGVKGKLDTPPPLWCDKSKAEKTDKQDDNDSN